MRAIARGLRNLWLDGRTLRWLARLRFELWRNGGRLRVEGWRGVRLAERPVIRTLPLGGDGGVTTVRLSPGLIVGYGVIFEIWAGADNRLELGPDTRVYERVRIELRGGEIAVGARTVIHDNSILQSGGELVLGEDCRVSYGSCLHCDQRVEMGDYASLAEYVVVVDSDHSADGSDTPIVPSPIRTDPVHLERNVFVTAGAVVLRGTHIGRNSLVGAQAVVRGGDYPAGWLLAGIPAKPIRALGADDRRNQSDSSNQESAQPSKRSPKGAG